MLRYVLLPLVYLGVPIPDLRFVDLTENPTRQLASSVELQPKHLVQPEIQSTVPHFRPVSYDQCREEAFEDLLYKFLSTPEFKFSAIASVGTLLA